MNHSFSIVDMPFDMLDFVTPPALMIALADRVSYELSVAIEERGQATLALCVSSSLVPFYAALAARDLAWEKVTVTLVDERCIPTSCERSHERFLRTYFLRDNAARARLIGLYTPAATAELAAFSAAKRINTCNTPFDVVLVTLASGGYIGSYLPGALRLKQALDRASKALVLALYGKNGQDARLSLTLPLLAEARFIALPLFGYKERERLLSALETNEEGFLSLHALLRAAVNPVQIYWAPQN